MTELETYKKSIIQGLGRIRKERRLTQTEFAKLLDLSQQHFSLIERGKGSISAEQFLLILEKFNLPINYFINSEPKDEGLVLQNALANLGAVHLREIPGIFIPEKYSHPNEIIFQILDTYYSSRLITGLAPVIVNNFQRINLSLIEKKLRDNGHENRLWWVLENTLSSLQTRQKEGDLARNTKLLYRRTGLALIANMLFREQVEKEKFFQQQNKSSEDIFDQGITTQKSLESLRSKRDEIARKWRIITSIKQSDFEEALKNAELS